MLSFRTLPPLSPEELQAAPPSWAQIQRLAAELMRPEHFFAGKGIILEWKNEEKEEVPWEIFHGRLLGPGQTRQRRVFEAWNLFATEEAGRSTEPILSLKLDESARQLHVLRAIHSHVWEGYEEGGAILSRETCRWVRELVGTVSVDQIRTWAELCDELTFRLFQAVVGTSRLPLTSLEAPLPAFSLGRLAYVCRWGVNPPDPGPIRSPLTLIEKRLTGELAWIEKAKLLEAVLHATPAEDLAATVDRFMSCWPTSGEAANMPGQEVGALLRTLFNEISLSPDTGMVDRALTFVRLLEEKRYLRPADRVDFLGYLLRQLGRHLTAYDLVTFHHRGANYPDALLLDAALKAYLELADRLPELFLGTPGNSQEEQQRKRLRRRALRQGWLLRQRYAGHPVPEMPTSEGENQRVLPGPFVRVPEDQILCPHRRTRRLYEADPLEPYLAESSREILLQSLADLHEPAELRELGLALFLDRPFNGGKSPLEPDQTLLLSYEAFSRSLAQCRLGFLTEKLQLISDKSEQEALTGRLKEMTVVGIPVSEIPGPVRPGSVTLADAMKVAEDFLLLRTTRQALRAFFRLYPPELFGEQGRENRPEGNHFRLLLRGEEAFALYDEEMHKHVDFDFDFRQGYISRAGIEYPASPPRVRKDVH